MPKRHGCRLAPVLAEVGWHQLGFTQMRQSVWRHRVTRVTVAEQPVLERGGEPLFLAGQLPLFDLVPDLSRVTLPLTFFKRPDLDHYPHLRLA